MYDTSIKLTNEENQVIIGTLLGDAHLSKRFFQFTQKNKAYCLFVYTMLTRLFTTTPKNVLTNYGTEVLRIRSYHPLFKRLRDVWYPNGKKIIPTYVYKQLDKQAIAHLIMDDGCLRKGSNTVVVATCSFTLRENIMLSNAINKILGTECRVDQSNGYNRLRFLRGDTRILLDALSIYFSKSMMYKLRKEFIITAERRCTEK